MKKQIKAIALATVLLLQFNICSARTYTNKEKYENFPDVIGTKYEDAALYLKAFGYVSGYPDGTYQPDKSITRAELVRMVFEFSFDAKKAISTQTEPLNNFSDVPTDHWAKQYIEVAAQTGIVSGYGDGTFKPDNPVTHAEALTMLMNVHGLKQAVTVFGNTWPDNYLICAISKKYSDIIKLEDYDVPVNRGDVAIYISNIREVKWE